MSSTSPIPASRNSLAQVGSNSHSSAVAVVSPSTSSTSSIALGQNPQQTPHQLRTKTATASQVPPDSVSASTSAALKPLAADADGANQLSNRTASFAPKPAMATAVPFDSLRGVREYLSQPVTAAFIAGGVAGAVSRTVVSPLERLKIIFQVQVPGNTSYNGVGPALIKMWKEEGFKGLMRGNGTNCIRIVPYSAVQFSSYTVYKKMLLKEGEPDLGTFRRLAAGAMAGITSVVATYPLDIVRTRLSIQSASFAALGKPDTKLPGMFATLKNMYVTEGGYIALYRGLFPTLAGVAPYVGINFATYEAMRKYFTRSGEANPTAVGKLCAGAVSGAVAQSITYPFDVLRRRFQVNTMSGLGYQYKSLWDAIGQILKVEGVRGMYKGLLPNLLKVAPSIGSSFLSFEIARDLLLSIKPVD